MDLERVRRNTAQNTAISQTGFDFNPLYHIENIENAKSKTCLSVVTASVWIIDVGVADVSCRKLNTSSIIVSKQLSLGEFSVSWRYYYILV